MGLEAVAFATGIGWISVVLYQIRSLPEGEKKQEFLLKITRKNS